MADDHFERRSAHTRDTDGRERSFHWPPTAEEMDSIQVMEVHDDPQPAVMQPAQPPRQRQQRERHWRWRQWRWWQRRQLQRRQGERREWQWRQWLGDRPVITQASVAAGSLAAIGIALTSLLTPAQPVRTSRGEARPAIAAKRPINPSTAFAAQQSASTLATAAAGAAAAPVETPPFRPMVDLELERRTASRPARSERVEPRQPVSTSARLSAGRGAAAPSARRMAAPASAAAARPSPAHTAAAELTASRSTVAAATDRRARERVLARRDGPARDPDGTGRDRAGQDPVSRFAARTGVSIWKAMRTVGRSFAQQSQADAGSSNSLW